MLIGIDTAENKKYSCTIFGFKSEMHMVFKKVDKILVDCNEKGIFHWKSMSKRVKQCAHKEICRELKNSKLKIIILEHQKPRNMEEVEFYLKIVPNELSSLLERILKGKYGFISFECDDDFFVKGCGKLGTERFLYGLLQKITFRLTGEMIKIRKEKRVLKSTIKQYKDKILQIRAEPVNRRDSEAVQLSDICLGLWRYCPELLKSKVYFKKL